MKALLFGLVFTLLILVANGCSSSDPLRSPSLSVMANRAPDSFQVEMITSAGIIDFRFYRSWSPLGVDRAFYLFQNNFYEGSRFYRVINNFVAQFGGSGDAGIDSVWQELSINDEFVRTSNKKGTISFARAGRRSRSFTMFVNLRDNVRLDSLDSGGVVGYPPIGRVISGMDVVEELFSGYAAAPMRTNLTAGVLRLDFPHLDSIASTAITRMY